MTKDKIYSKYAVILDKGDLFMLGARSIEEAKKYLENNSIKDYPKIY